MRAWWQKHWEGATLALCTVTVLAVLIIALFIVVYGMS